jgi:DNA-binding transcriptional MerR regulator
VDQWTLSELVAEAGRHIARLPAPKNGQVRAVPDERTVRYYVTLDLLDRPVAMRGRTALYGRRHLAQVVAIKRLQGAGRSLAEIQALWPGLDDGTLQHMTGIEVPRAAAATKREFWKKPPVASPAQEPEPEAAPPPVEPAPAPLELRIALAPGVTLALALDEHHDTHITSADVRAIRAAALPIIQELASRRPAYGKKEET